MPERLGAARTAAIRFGGSENERRLFERCSVGFGDFCDRFLPADEAPERVEFLHIIGGAADPALDHSPPAAHREVIHFTIVTRSSGFDEVDPLMQINRIIDTTDVDVAERHKYGPSLPGAIPALP